MRFAIKTFGCRTNIAESEWLISKLLAQGFCVDNTDPDILIINTCTVTENATRKIRQFINATHTKKPAGSIIVFGCGVRQKDNQYSAMDAVDMSLDDEEEVYEYVIEKFASTSPQLETEAPNSVLRSRATIKVQEGCNEFCSYCIIPLVRGRERSLPLKQIIAMAKQKEQEGYHEIVLTGTHIGHYGLDLEPALSIRTLVDAILEATHDIRIRISSIEPEMFDLALYEIFGYDRVCPHIHLCLQSGSDTVLSLMGRRYTTKEFQIIVQKVREVRPDIAITTDVIVGFPGEKEEHFQETKQYIERIAFAKLHVFPFSVRPQTRAGYMTDMIDMETIQERSRILQQLSEKLETAYATSYIGQSVDVVFENEYKGISGNYLEVYVSDPHEPRTLSTVTITKVKERFKVEGR